MTGSSGEGGAPRPIARTSLHDLVVGRLRDHIVSGHVPPGQRINESELGRYLNVSRTPIREALKVLAAEGLVELSQNKGAIVPKLSRAELEDALLFLSAIEAFAAEQMAIRATAEQRSELERLHESMVIAYEQSDRRKYFQLNQNIHSFIVEAAGNRTLQGVHTALQARMQRHRYLGNDEPAHWRVSVTEHKRILDGICQGDPRAASSAMRLHLENAIGRIEAVMSRLGDENT